MSWYFCIFFTMQNFFFFFSVPCVPSLWIKVFLPKKQKNDGSSTAGFLPDVERKYIFINLSA